MKTQEGIFEEMYETAPYSCSLEDSANSSAGICCCACPQDGQSQSFFLKMLHDVQMLQIKTAVKTFAKRIVQSYQISA
jgi:hypothetical protein